MNIEQTSPRQESQTDRKLADCELTEPKRPWRAPTAALHGIDIVRNGIIFNIVGDGSTTCQS